jgi:hypothetical protein
MVGERVQVRHFVMDACCLCRIIRVNRAGDDPCMYRAQIMQANEVASIQRKQDSIFQRGKREDLIVWNLLVRSTRLERGQYVVARRAQL